MMITAIDTNILLDLRIPDSPHGASSNALLGHAYREGALVICAAVYAELAAFLGSEQDIDAFLRDTGIRLEHPDRAALYAAGQAWRRYTTRRRSTLQCPACGQEQVVGCSTCGRSLSPRQHVLADFLIGAHALTQADVLLTRDRGHYRTYFPTLKLLTQE